MGQKLILQETFRKGEILPLFLLFCNNGYKGLYGGIKMKIGTLIALEVFSQVSNETEKCHCKVIEKSKSLLFIDYPIHEETKKTVFLTKGKKVSITYVGEDKAVYNFHSEIVKKLKLTVPALAINFPEKANIERIQRREFVRIETAVDVAIHGSDNRFSPFITVTSDISGGGLSVVIPRNNTLEAEKIVDIWLIIQLSSGEYYYIYAEAMIVLIQSLNHHSIKTASLKFTSITKQAQQNIIRYCFEKQRDARKKELL